MVALRAGLRSADEARPLPPLTSVSLRNDSVALSPLMPEDTGLLFTWMNDVDAARLDLAYRPTDWLTFKAWLDELGRSHTQIVFAIRKLFEPQMIGFVIFKNIHPVHRSTEIGIRIGDECDRSKGYGTGALTLALQYAWNHLNLERVSLTVFAHNRRAIASYRACTFREEGRFFRGAYIDGEWVDVIPMAALRPSR
ncbi:MAG TPA: GNAT family protein [Rhizomicrobium sp.]|nr:GNAT family protein [Rhizomicrobium sp.]